MGRDLTAKRKLFNRKERKERRDKKSFFPLRSLRSLRLKILSG
jgi:hypothetical protein